MKNPKLKKDEYGDYIYDGRYRICNLGYDRITGGRRWDVSRTRDGKMVFDSGTLRDAVARIEKAKKGGAK